MYHWGARRFHTKADEKPISLKTVYEISKSLGKFLGYAGRYRHRRRLGNFVCNPVNDEPDADWEARGSLEILEL